jgi:outer membrane lipoprotein SlyB
MKKIIFVVAICSMFFVGCERRDTLSSQKNRWSDTDTYKVIRVGGHSTNLGVYEVITDAGEKYIVFSNGDGLAVVKK